ncbi:MAG TPA: hypothetical protein VFZ21_11395 [Gemmatimonadaceae bacterium]|jgi:hypothetical protein|nr:hypothetical protein [Gemmatimonadaceae bacterium]
MKRLALVAAVLALAACTTKEETPVDTTAAPAMAPAPADTAAPMDTSMRMDSAMKDTTAKKP